MAEVPVFHCQPLGVPDVFPADLVPVLAAESAALSVPGLVPVFLAVPLVLFPLALLLPVVPLPLSVQMTADFLFLMTPLKPAMILYRMPMFLMTVPASGQALVPMLVPAAKLLARWAAVPASL